ncbi:hypothetical protein PSHT_02660 [Puccinia striiformis]|uniref:Uncharacterized protein n=1 Tax=Puccinia striiformis TaxID=27350 RepID=A0A2S4WHG1_9BASI|nr:hypothetical protein PSHT_02660 [Puccinia striiformis]
MAAPGLTGRNFARSDASTASIPQHHGGIFGHQGDRQDPSIEAAELNKDLRNRVHSNLFPILRHQIIIASRALDPINLSGEPLSTLQSILMIQSQLDHTLNQFPSALQRIGRVMSTLRSGRTNDQYLKEFKYFRGGGLFYLYTSRVIKELVKLFKQSYRLIRQMGLSFERNHDPTRIDATRQLILEHTSSACKEIDSAIEWLEGSEFDLVQWDWPSEICNINEQLEDLMYLINHASLDQADSKPTNELLNQRNMRLAKTIPPIVKLSRLFLEKLSRRGHEH